MASRIIEKNKTYRVFGKGKYSLFHVVNDDGKTVTIKDLSTNKEHTVNKKSFVDRLNDGSITVSASA